MKPLTFFLCLCSLCIATPDFVQAQHTLLTETPENTLPPEAAARLLQLQQQIATTAQQRGSAQRAQAFAVRLGELATLQQRGVLPLQLPGEPDRLVIKPYHIAYTNAENYTWRGRVLGGHPMASDVVLMAHNQPWPA